MARKKITATTDNSEWKAPKKRKPRKPMSDEQKAAASERLAKARAAKIEKNPNYGQGNIHESLRHLPAEHQLSPTKVKQWINVQQEYAKSERFAVRQNVKGAIARLASHEGYIRNMISYLRYGSWIDMFYGEQQQSIIRNRCIAVGHYWYGPKKDQPKRDVGTFYNDIGCTYTEEMFEEERGYEQPREDAGGEREKGPVARKKRKGSKAS
jgi:hypothetical protein